MSESDEMSPAMIGALEDMKDGSLRVWRNGPDGGIEVGVDEMTDDERTAVLALLVKLRQDAMN